MLLRKNKFFNLQKPFQIEFLHKNLREEKKNPNMISLIKNTDVTVWQGYFTDCNSFIVN